MAGFSEQVYICFPDRCFVFGKSVKKEDILAYLMDFFSSVLHNQENASPSTLTSNEKCDCHSQRTTFNVFFAYSEGNRQDADRTWRALIGCRASQSSSSLLGIHFFSESFRIQHNYIYFLSSGLVFLNLNSAW